MATMKAATTNQSKLIKQEPAASCHKVAACLMLLAQLISGAGEGELMPFDVMPYPRPYLFGGQICWNSYSGSAKNGHFLRCY